MAAFLAIVEDRKGGTMEIIVPAAIDPMQACEIAERLAHDAAGGDLADYFASRVSPVERVWP